MTKKEWEAEFQLSSDLERRDQPATEETDAAPRLVLGVLADFRGGEKPNPAPPAVPLRKRKFHEIDRDSFDEVLARFDVCWRGQMEGMPGGAQAAVPIELRFRELDDFHPDSIVQRVPALRTLHGLLSDLDDPSRFDEAAAKVARWAEPKEALPAAKPPAPAPSMPPAGPIDGARVLDAILGQPRASVSQPSDIDRLVREIVEPHIVKVDGRRQESLIAAVNQALSCLVSSILHDPGFQMQEALWRSLHRLVNVADSGTRIRIVHVRKDEMLADIISGKSMESSELAALLLDPASVPGTERVSLLIGSYEFSHDLEDLAILERLGNIGAVLKAPFVAGASPWLFGCKSFAELPGAAEVEELFEGQDHRPWHLLRQTRAARWLALAMPRMLCRLPYGPRTQPAESFSFEEQLNGADHEKLVWGNPAFGVAAVFAGAFAAEGWQMNPAETVARLEGLPLYMYRDDAETITKPCAEVLMGEGLVEALMGAGMLPLVSYRDKDIVSFPSLQTLAQPRVPLRL